MIKISKRLEAIASFIDGGKILDLGCDHGFLAIYLKQKGFDVSASDIKKSIIDNAKNNINKYDLEIPLFISDGFQNINDFFDVVIIAGMGGDLMKKLLNHPFHSKYILSPHKNAHIVRKHMMEKGYLISREEVIYDKKWYEIIEFIKGYKSYSEEELMLGPIIIKNMSNDYKNYLINKYKKARNDKMVNYLLNLK